MRCRPQIDEKILVPGRYVIGDASCRMRTMLDSGVVIALWHGARRVGAMAHFLPSAEGPGIPLELDGHAGPDGLELVLQALQVSGVDPAECIARICGRSNAISRVDRVPSLNTGQVNGEFARRLLRACGLAIRSERFYTLGRYQVIFDVNTGSVQTRRVKPVVVAIDAKLPAPLSPAVMPGQQRTGTTGRNAGIALSARPDRQQS